MFLFWGLGLLYAAATSYYFAREAVEAHLIVTKTLIDSVLREIATKQREISQ